MPFPGQNPQDINGGLTTGLFGSPEIQDILGDYDAWERVQEIQDYNAVTYGDASASQVATGVSYDPNRVAEAMQSPENAYNAWQASLDRAYNTSEREAAQAYSSSEAVKAYERELAAESTKYQRLMGDLQAAGINPLYAFGSGGASAASVSSSAASSTGASSSGTKAGSSSAKAVGSLFTALARIFTSLV